MWTNNTGTFTKQLLLVFKSFGTGFQNFLSFWTSTEKGVPPQDPYFLKNGQINRVTKVSSTFSPTVTLILGAEIEFENTW